MFCSRSLDLTSLTNALLLHIYKIRSTPSWCPAVPGLPEDGTVVEQSDFTLTLHTWGHNAWQNGRIWWQRLENNRLKVVYVIDSHQSKCVLEYPLWCPTRLGPKVFTLGQTYWSLRLLQMIQGKLIQNKLSLNLSKAKIMLFGNWEIHSHAN